jgi:hypothetical protein
LAKKEEHTFKKAKNGVNTNISAYLETSGSFLASLVSVSWCALLALLSNIRIGWQNLVGTNKPTYLAVG